MLNYYLGLAPNSQKRIFMDRQGEFYWEYDDLKPYIDNKNVQVIPWDNWTMLLIEDKSSSSNMPNMSERERERLLEDHLKWLRNKVSRIGPQQDPPTELIVETLPQHTVPYSKFGLTTPYQIAFLVIEPIKETIYDPETGERRNWDLWEKYKNNIERNLKWLERQKQGYPRKREQMLKVGQEALDRLDFLYDTEELPLNLKDNQFYQTALFYLDELERRIDDDDIERAYGNISNAFMRLIDVLNPLVSDMESASKDPDAWRSISARSNLKFFIHYGLQ